MMEEVRPLTPSRPSLVMLLSDPLHRTLVPPGVCYGSEIYGRFQPLIILRELYDYCAFYPLMVGCDFRRLFIPDAAHGTGSEVMMIDM